MQIRKRGKKLNIMVTGSEIIDLINLALEQTAYGVSIFGEISGYYHTQPEYDLYLVSKEPKTGTEFAAIHGFVRGVCKASLVLNRKK